MRLMSLWLRLLGVLLIRGAGAGVAAESSHQPPRKQLWNAEELWDTVIKLEEELAGARTDTAKLLEENDALRKGHAVDGSQFESASSDHGHHSQADHGSTLFITMCAGTVYFTTYCGPFFASFERAYGPANVLKHRLVALTSNVDPRLLAAARKRFRPWGHFETLSQEDLRDGKAFTESHYGSAAEWQDDALECGVELHPGQTGCKLSSESIDKRDMKTSLDSLWFPWRVAAYLRDHASGFCYAAVMDSDLLFVRPLGQFLPDCSLQNDIAIPAVDWDVAFTVYDPKFRVPWADEPSKVGRTGKGFRRINCGVVLLSLGNITMLQPEMVWPG